VIGLDVQQQDPVSKVVFVLAEFIDKQDTHIDTLQARIASQVMLQQGFGKTLSLAKAITEAKDKAFQARKEQIDLGNEADRRREEFVERLVKLFEEHRKETASDR
jgi:predicted Holliday junction resolvase-like endonuclease